MFLLLILFEMSEHQYYFASKNFVNMPKLVAYLPFIFASWLKVLQFWIFARKIIVISQLTGMCEHFSVERHESGEEFCICKWFSTMKFQIERKMNSSWRLLKTHCQVNAVVRLISFIELFVSCLMKCLIDFGITKMKHVLIYPFFDPKVPFVAKSTIYISPVDWCSATVWAIF